MNRFTRKDLRRTRRLPAVPLAVAGGAFAGLCLGFGLSQMVSAPPGHMAEPLAIAGGITLAIAAALVLQALWRGGAFGLEKHGAAASTRDDIEPALAAPGCAVAHSVTGTARQ